MRESQEKGSLTWIVSCLMPLCFCCSISLTVSILVLGVPLVGLSYSLFFSLPMCVYCYVLFCQIEFKSLACSLVKKWWLFRSSFLGMEGVDQMVHRIWYRGKCYSCCSLWLEAFSVNAGGARPLFSQIKVCISLEWYFLLK